MDRLRQLIMTIKDQGLATGRFLGLLHLLIGRRISLEGGEVVSQGIPWRDVAALLKRCRWDKQSVRELGLEPSDLPPRDRERYWYLAIVRSAVDSPEAVRSGDDLARLLTAFDYEISQAPRAESDDS